MMSVRGALGKCATKNIASQFAASSSDDHTLRPFVAAVFAARHCRTIWHVPYLFSMSSRSFAGLQRNVHAYGGELCRVPEGCRVTCNDRLTINGEIFLRDSPRPPRMHACMFEGAGAWSGVGQQASSTQRCKRFAENTERETRPHSLPPRRPLRASTPSAFLAPEAPRQT